MSFSDKVVIVTGASSGIGAATAKLFAQEKAHVTMVGRNVEKLTNVSNDIKTKTGVEPLVVVADVSKEDEARGIVEKTIQKYGKLDILINNAGVVAYTSIFNEDYLKEFDRIMGINLRAVVVMTHAAAGHLVKTKGNIVNVSSIGSTLSSALLSVYGSSKAGLDHFSRCIALEFAKEGVRVNVVNPGPVKTDIGLTLGNTREELEAGYVEASTKTPLKLISESEEVADIIAYLASDKAKSITGATYTLDCGVSLVGFAAME